jgi:two-component system chemotaxis response regulator CheB
MTKARVLMIDDSLTMCGLFGSVLDRASGIEVVGMAGDANEASEMIARLEPNVITLDVELPGKNGMEVLQDIMRLSPTPVIMLSSQTHKGSDMAARAIELGAFASLGKPGASMPGEFKALAGKLVSTVKAAANSSLGQMRSRRRFGGDAFDGSDRIIAMSASVGGPEALLAILPAFPAACPPTIVVLQIEQQAVDLLLRQLRASCTAQVVLAENAMPLAQGTIYLVTDPDSHAAIDQWPDPSLYLHHHAPINGCRPSASVLYASLATLVGANAVGAILTGTGTDGVAGFKLLRTAGGFTVIQNSETCVADQASAAAAAAGAALFELPLAEIAASMLDACCRPAMTA